MSTQLPQSADAVIVGGGIVGLSTALHLAERGVTNVAVLDRGLFADGTTPQSAGQTLSLANPASPIAPFRKYCNDFINSYEDRVGYPVNHNHPGAVHVAAAARFRDAVAEEWRHGGDPMTAEDVRRMVPGLTVPDDCRALYVQQDGWVDPRQFATGLGARARDLGVNLLSDVTVTGIAQDVAGATVHTADGSSVSAAKVAVCGGAWTRGLVARLGVQIPAVGVRHQFLTTIPFPGVDAGMPLIRLIDDQIYMRPHLGGIAYGGYGVPTVAVEPEDFAEDFQMRDLPASISSVPLLREMAGKWFTALATTPLTNVSRGIITMTPDHLPLIGPLAGMDDVLIATGCQVSGIAQSPGWGRILASLLTDSAFGESGDPLAGYARLTDPRRFGNEPLTDELRQAGVDSYNRLFWWNLGSDLSKTATP